MGSQSSNYEFFWFDDVTIALLPTISNIFVNGNRVTINFTAGAGDPPSAFTLLSSDTVDGVYAPATGALIAGGAGSYEAAVPTNGPAQFYRLRR
jgi:hypothetical protein